MQKRFYFNLKKLNETRFFIRPEELEKAERSLDVFLGDTRINTEAFARRVMFTEEIRANNQVEGYGDDVETIRTAIKNTDSIQDRERRARIVNLYNAYNYILTLDTVDKETLRELYGIISKDSLDPYEAANMGKYYRTKPVYILNRGRLDESMDEGIPVEKIDEFMEQYFKFLESSLTSGTETEKYIKSQILHFYFVYIHPYFDMNGRTSRTLAMWYLLNRKAYAFIMFNRGISFKDNVYDKTIIRTKQTGDMTYFIELMLETVELELEKEYVMHELAEQSNSKLSAKDYQTLLYMLSMKGDRNILTFANMYNRNTNSDRKRVKEIYEEMVVPLLDKGILDVGQESKKEVQGIRNKQLQFRPVELDPNRSKNIRL